MSKQFGREKLIKDISASTLQVAIIQVFSLVIFYFTSRYLAKDDFGELNWSTAVGSTLISFASLGLDVVFVRRIAAGQNALVMSGIHFFHTIVAALFLSTLVLANGFIFPSFTQLHPLFFIVFINLCLVNMGNSFRLALMGLEVYKYLAILALIANVFKLGLILTLYGLHYFSVTNVIYSFIATSFLEFLLGYYFVSKSLAARVKPLLRVVEYKYFIFEALPQLGVVVFDSAIARVDWILLGLLSTATVTADYSFTSRIYESSKLPMFIIAPILLTRFSRLFSDPDKITDKSKADIAVFFKLALFISMFIPVVCICVWSPLVDYFTDNKYGRVNEMSYLILASCVPLNTVINFLWSMGCAQGHLKSIMFITIAAAIVNIVLNLIFIPLYGGEGAAFAFLMSTFIQTCIYIKYTRQDHIRLNIKTCLLAFGGAILSVVLGKTLSGNIILSPIIAMLTLTVFAVLTKQVSYKEIRAIIKKD